jgi:peroxiredoxin
MSQRLQFLSLFVKNLLGGKSTDMSALPAGTRAPMFALPLLGGGTFDLSAALKQGPVVLVFFKIGCPVCQMALPFYERAFLAYGAGAQVVGISQDGAENAQKFCDRFGVTFPVALDDPAKYRASNAYGLTNVPTMFWISPEGFIEISAVSWDKGEFELAAERMSAGAHLPGISIFRPGEQVPAFRPG